MPSRTPAALAAIGFVALATSPAAACRGGECYDKVRLPDVYETVDRPVILRPGYREVVETEPIVVMRSERVLVAPRRVEYVRTPPVTRTALQEVVVRRGGWRWETTYGPYGERRCKVRVPPEIKLVPREVVVAPSRTVRVVSPPVYAMRERAVAVRPATRIIYDRPPVVGRERARVLVKRGNTAWVRAANW